MHEVVNKSMYAPLKKRVVDVECLSGDPSLQKELQSNVLKMKYLLRQPFVMQVLSEKADADTLRESVGFLWSVLALIAYDRYATFPLSKRAAIRELFQNQYGQLYTLLSPFPIETVAYFRWIVAEQFPHDTETERTGLRH